MGRHKGPPKPIATAIGFDLVKAGVYVAFEEFVHEPRLEDEHANWTALVTQYVALYGGRLKELKVSFHETWRSPDHRQIVHGTLVVTATIAWGVAPPIVAKPEPMPRKRRRED